MNGSTPSCADSRLPVPVSLSPARRVTLAAVLVGAAGLLAVVESSLPLVAPLPWLRLGLANAAVVVAFLVGGPRMALAVSAGRVLIAGLLVGTFGGPAFALSVAGAAASYGVMWALHRRAGLTAVGWSAAGAVAHVAGQFALASVLLSSRWLLTLLPASGLVALAFGALVGHLALIVSSRLPLEWSGR